ncbi:MAG: hypothetical protein A2X86_03420 [Bdellovibrionales bacterium GWA2_49_15]|nr:MAG: hypothetical protein A2X86_03420 [Bdellovibrionales bacterium GWA2_49_15]
MNGLNIEIDANTIAKRAYELHLGRKNAGGDALSDWLMAEAELKNELMCELNKDSAPLKKNGKSSKNSKATKN